MRRLPFVVVDVFTTRPLAGNGLVVFTDARGASDAEMQAIARETNQSETTFVLPREPVVEAGAGVRVRIFTVEEELPFAGHPTLGTAWVLRALGGRGDTVTLDLTVGKIPVSFGEREAGLFGEMRQVDPSFGAAHAPADVAALAGLEVSDIDPAVPIETVSTGNAFVIVPLRTLDAARRLRLDGVRANEYLARTGSKFFYFVTRETVRPDARLHARMQFYGGEDPATGSAAGPCAAWMVRHGLAEPDAVSLIEQGLEIQRPSELYVRAGRRDGAVTDVRVGGHVVEVGRGELTLPG